MIRGIENGLAQFGIVLIIMLAIALLMDWPEQKRKRKLKAEKDKKQQEDFERQLTAEINAQFELATNRMRDRQKVWEKALNDVSANPSQIVSIPGLLAEFRSQYTGKEFNHEVWWKCKNCGCEYDARLSSICDFCKHDNEHGA